MIAVVFDTAGVDDVLGCTVLFESVIVVTVGVVVVLGVVAVH